MQMLDKALSEKEARNFLGGFAFHGDMATAPVAPLSGGERARLVLALIVYQQPNLLLLDEPTNHLDLDMRHALCLALQDFEGALILVSHDRHLLRTVCDELVLVANGGAEPFSGDLDDYAKWLLATRDGDEDGSERIPAQPSRQQNRKNRADQRKALQPLRNRIKKLESELENLHAQKSAVDEKLADPELYESSNTDLQKSLGLQSAELASKLEDIEGQWLMACEELETAEAAE
jgi:ATP-binding cassette subfamily F protein 3